jgi:hypothetical protein
MTRGEMEQVIDALEYRVAQLEDRLFKEANDTDKRALRHRRQMYYKVINEVTINA